MRIKQNSLVFLVKESLFVKVNCKIYTKCCNGKYIINVLLLRGFTIKQNTPKPKTKISIGW